MMFAWGFGRVYLGMVFGRVAWGSGLLGTSILEPLLHGVLLGVDLLGAVRQKCVGEEYVKKIDCHTQIT